MTVLNNFVQNPIKTTHANYFLSTKLGGSEMEQSALKTSNLWNSRKNIVLTC